MNVDSAYFIINGGLQKTVIETWVAERLKGFEAINEIAVRYGAELDKNASYGTLIEGLYFKVDPGKVWKPIAKLPGYYRPNKANKFGKEIFKALSLIKIPSQQDLAVKLGCPPFFQICGQHYGTEAGFSKVGLDFYVETPLRAPIKVMDGVIAIARAEYFTAVDAKKDA